MGFKKTLRNKLLSVCIHLSINPSTYLSIYPAIYAWLSFLITCIFKFKVEFSPVFENGACQFPHTMKYWSRGPICLLPKVLVLWRVGVMKASFNLLSFSPNTCIQWAGYSFIIFYSVLSLRFFSLNINNIYLWNMYIDPEESIKIMVTEGTRRIKLTSLFILICLSCFNA